MMQSKRKRRTTRTGWYVVRCERAGAHCTATIDVRRRCTVRQHGTVLLIGNSVVVMGSSSPNMAVEGPEQIVQEAEQFKQ